MRRDLRNDDPLVRRTAAKTLGFLGREGHAGEAVPDLIELVAAIEDSLDLDARLENEDLRAYTEALDMISSPKPEIVPALTKFLNHKNANVRYMAGTALLKMGPAAAQAVPALKRARKDPDPSVGNLADAALRAIEKKKRRFF